MAHQITLTDDDYAALASASRQSGKPIERLIHEAIAAQYAPLAPSQPSATYDYPTGEPLTQEEREELERLAQDLGSERPWLSDIVIHDRDRNLYHAADPCER